MLTRRQLTVTTLAFLGASGFRQKPVLDISALETKLGGRIGLYALDLASGESIAHRADERFAMCSTFKVVLAACLLQRADEGSVKLDAELTFIEDDILANSPITGAQGSGAITISELCRAAVERSDNTAANLLLHHIGGPVALTAFFRSLGDDQTRLDRFELDLNSNLPGDPRDTTTPRAMTETLRALLGEPSALSTQSRQMLLQWMLNEQNGIRRIRAGAAQDWAVANKPGTSINGAVNDIAFLRRPGGGGVILSLYTNAPGVKIRHSEAVIAETAQGALASLTAG